MPSEYWKSNTVLSCPLISRSAMSRFDVEHLLILRFRLHAWKLLDMSGGISAGNLSTTLLYNNGYGILARLLKL